MQERHLCQLYTEGDRKHCGGEATGLPDTTLDTWVSVIMLLRGPGPSSLSEEKRKDAGETTRKQLP